MKSLPDVVSLIARSHLGLDGLFDHDGAAGSSFLRGRLPRPRSSPSVDSRQQLLSLLLSKLGPRKNRLGEFPMERARKRAVFFDGSRKSAVRTLRAAGPTAPETTAGAARSVPCVIRAETLRQAPQSHPPIPA